MILKTASALPVQMRNLKQHLPCQYPENFCTPKRAEITLPGMVLPGQMRNLKLGKGKIMGAYLLISDAAKAVKVESHVLRYS